MSDQSGGQQANQGGGNQGGGQQQQNNQGGGQQQNNQGGGQQQNNQGGQQQQQQQPWYAPLKPDADGVKFIEDRKFDGFGSLLKSAISSDTLARSRNVIELPDAKAPQDWKGYDKLGWVEDRAKYAPKAPQVKEGEAFNQGMWDATVNAAHKHKLAPFQIEGVYGEVMQFMNGETAKQTAANAGELKKVNDALRGEWGQDYDANHGIAKQALTSVIERFGIKAADTKLLDQVLGTPGFVKMFHAIGDALSVGEGGDFSHNAGGAGGGGQRFATPGQLQAEIRRLEADPLFLAALNDPRNSQHEDFKAQRARLIDRLAKMGGGQQAA